MKLRYHKWLSLGAMVGLLLSALPALPQAPQQKRNIMLIVADDRLRRHRPLWRRRGSRHADARHRQARERGHDTFLVLRPTEPHRR